MVVFSWWGLCFGQGPGKPIEVLQRDEKAEVGIVTITPEGVYPGKLTRGRIFSIDLKVDGHLDWQEMKSSVGGFLDIGLFNDHRDLLDADIESMDKLKLKYREVVPVGVKLRVRGQSRLYDVQTEDVQTENETGQSLRVLQDLDQVLEEMAVTEGLMVRVAGIQALEEKK